MVISRRRFAENLKETHGINKQAREGRAKLLFLSIKYANFVASLILNIMNADTMSSRWLERFLPRNPFAQPVRFKRDEISMRDKHVGHIVQKR